MILSTPPARAAHKLTSTQKALLLDALYFYRRQMPPDLVGALHELIAAAHTAAYFLQE